MRFFLWRCKNFIITLLSATLCCGLVLWLSASSVCRFSDFEGERAFYLYSASSQGLRKQTLGLSDFKHVRGESVRVALKGESAEVFAGKLLEKYGAELIFTEEACGVRSYYAYTPLWADGVWINGEKINLHIAVREEKDVAVVGSPIIFDGY